jgi:hypothetical protein
MSCGDGLFDFSQSVPEMLQAVQLLYQLRYALFVQKPGFGVVPHAFCQDFNGFHILRTVSL